MFEVAIEVEGAEDLERKLAQAPRIVRDELTRATTKSLVALQYDITDYPEQPPGTPYKRTGLYGKTWLYKIRGMTGDIWGQIGTNLEYAPYVRGPWQPEWMEHWKHLKEIIEDDTNKIRGFFEKGLRNIADRLRR